MQILVFRIRHQPDVTLNLDEIPDPPLHQFQSPSLWRRVAVVGAGEPRRPREMGEPVLVRLPGARPPVPRNAVEMLRFFRKSGGGELINISFSREGFEKVDGDCGV